MPRSHFKTAQEESDAVLSIAKKYYERAYPFIEPLSKDDFDRAINWKPSFNGKTKDHVLATSLSREGAVIAALVKAPNLTLALACAVFDIASDDRTAALNLGSAIALYHDNSANPAVRAQREEIYADAETVLFYSLNISMVNSEYSEGSLEPLVTLGNLYLDMGRYEDAKEMFETALRVSPDHLPALDGMMLYYMLTKKPQQAAMTAATAQKRPSEIGKAANDIDDNVRPAGGQEAGGLSSEEEMEALMDKLAEVEVVSYADLFKNVDAAYAERIRKSLNAIKDKMTFTVPDVSMLTQYTNVDEGNYQHVAAAMRAVGQEIETLMPYLSRVTNEQLVDGAGKIDNVGFNIKVGGMNLSDLMRDAVANPQRYKDANLPKATVDMGSIMGFANDAMASAAMFMKGDFSKDTFRPLARADPLIAVMGIDPFEYANSLDVLVQQYNIAPFKRKLNTLCAYLSAVNGKAASVIGDVRMTWARENMKIIEAETEAENKLNDWFVKETERDGYTERILLEYKLRTHDIHRDFYPRYNHCASPYWHQATQAAAVAYKKLEKYLPKMYKEIMTHIAAISDPKVRDTQERRLNHAVITAVHGGITNLLGAYGLGGFHDTRTCTCDLEELKDIRARLIEEERRIGNEYYERQKQKMNSFKNAEIDFNSSWYKDYIKKWEYAIDLGVYEYRTSEFYTLTKANVWTPAGSFESSSFINNISNAGRKSADLTLGPSAGSFSLEAKFGYTVDFVRDSNGSDHIRDIDVRASLEGKVGVGPVAAAAGASASIARGTKVYGNVGLTGNKRLDEMKGKILGDKVASWANMPGLPQAPDLTLNLWNGEYVL